MSDNVALVSTDFNEREPLILDGVREKLYGKLRNSHFQDLSDRAISDRAIYDLAYDVKRFCEAMIKCVTKEFDTGRDRIGLLEERELLVLAQDLFEKAKRHRRIFWCVSPFLAVTILGLLPLVYWYDEGSWMVFGSKYFKLREVFGNNYFPYEVFRQVLAHNFNPGVLRPQTLAQMLAPCGSQSKKDGIATQ